MPGHRRQCSCDENRWGQIIYSPLANCEIHAPIWDELSNHRISYATPEDAQMAWEEWLERQSAGDGWEFCPGAPEDGCCECRHDGESCCDCGFLP